MTPIVHVLGIIPESKTTLNNLTYKDTVLFKYSLIISSMPVQGIQSGPVPGIFTRLRSCIVPAEITEPPKISGGQNHKYD